MANVQEHSNALTPDALMVVVSVIMGLLTCLLLVRGLLGRLSGADTSHPTVRFFLSVVFALFLPLTSYMFSEAKNSHGKKLRAQLILMWMLLAELLRKKVEGVSAINASILQGVNTQSTWDAVDQIVHIAWLGFLIYRYESDGVFIVLWAFSIVKVARRVAAVEVAKRCFALGKNPHLIAGYMRQLSTEKQQQETAATGEKEENATLRAMKACKYVIMGEDKVKKEAGPLGYSLELKDAKEMVTTVGDVWRLAASHDALFSSEWLNVKDLCLSFALYKLLRRRFEEYPSAEAGRPESLDFLLCGLLGDDKDISPKERRSADEHKGERVFRVVENELTFLSDYYYCTIRVTQPNLWFFLLDSALMIVVLLFCCVTIIIYVIFERDSFLRRLFDPQDGIMEGPNMYDLIVTVILIATLVLLEFGMAVAYVVSDWVMVSLLCTYEKKQSWQQSASVRLALTALRSVKTCFKRRDLKFNQHSVIEPRGRTLWIFSQLVLRRHFLKVQSMLLKPVLSNRFLGVQSTPVPKEVKAAIVKYLVDSKGSCPVLPIGEPALLPVRESDGAADTIIIWHIATCLYEMKHPSRQQPQQSDEHQQPQQSDEHQQPQQSDEHQQPQQSDEHQQPQQSDEHQQPQQSDEHQQPQQSDEHNTQANRRIAETLSKYCAYLVALAPELLPDDAAATTIAYKDAVREIQEAILKEHDSKDFERVTKIRKAKGTAAERGAELGHQLVEAVGDERRVWKVLAERWTEIVVYIAPSKDVKSHARALAHGGEFITHIWALLTHGGILQWPDQSPV